MDFKKGKVKEKKSSILKRLLPYMGKKKILFPIALVLSGISAVLNILPLLFLWFIARELFINVQGINIQSISFYGWLTFLSAILAVIVYFGALVASHLAAFRAEVGIRKVGMRKIINMPLGFFDTVSSGKVRKLIDDNASQTHSFLAHQMPDLAGTIVSPILLIVLMFVFDWKLGLVSLIPIILGFFAMSFMTSKEGVEWQKKYMTSLEEMSSESVEYVRGIPVVKTFGQSVFAFKRFVGSITRYRDMVTKFTLMWTKPMSFYQSIMESAAFFLVPFAVLFITNGGQLGKVLTDFVFYLLVAPNFGMVLMRSMYFQNYTMVAKQITDRFDELLSYPTMDFPTKGETPQKHAITFKNVSFAYEGANKNAIDDISFSVDEGKTLALVGASGGGKTTIARLAARFWDIQTGEIFIGGVNIKNIGKKELMDTIAFVFQNTHLFKTSLKENIVYGKQGISSIDIEQALKLSQSKEIIDSLPDGLDTVIGTKGTYLSGGEQQRIALARAILKNAPIVLLDEATAFADPENEHLIQAALKELSKGKTTLMIAHRLTTVMNADKILVIDKGKVAEQGTHSELLAKNGLYKTMWDEYQKSIEWKI